MAIDEGVRETPQDHHMTVGELADFLQVHPSMQLHASIIYRLLRQGKLPAFKVGPNWCFSRQAIHRLVQLYTGN